MGVIVAGNTIDIDPEVIQNIVSELLEDINYSILTVNGTYRGITLNVIVDTNTVGIGGVLCQGSDFHFDDADADAIATTYMLAIALQSGTGSKKVLLRGLICKTTWDWDPGPVYLSTDTGLLQQTIVSGESDVNICIGFALSATCIYFNPYLYWTERTA